jgi:hypothetical protein
MPPAISTDLMSITRLAEKLSVNRMYLSGLVDGMGIETTRGGQNAKAIQTRHIPEIERTIRRLTAVKRG